ncbi:glycosyltransferase [Agromyces atrinae]|uniref:glycosyltransferase n=1 Tax=Agromyces atrinae TaxID=592376 RepID=UPI001F5A77D4|nr:glycosyltransferase [Agromyces atrinae]MCI2956177.1 glycosyltransferase [Agromyces atrinae]
MSDVAARFRRARRPRVLAVHPGAELYGSDRVLLESVAGFVADDMDVTVVLPADGPLVAALRDTGARVEIAPTLVLRKSLVSLRGVPALVGQSVLGAVHAWRAISRFRPDAVYVSTVTIPLWPVIARLRRTRVMSHVHEAESSASSTVLRLLYLPHRAAHAVVVNSEFSRGVIASVDPDLGERSVVVYNGVAGPAAPSAARENLTGDIRLAYLGRLSPRKGPDLVVEAVIALRGDGLPVRADLIGAVFSGYEWFEDELREKIAAHGLHDAVALTGFHSDVWPFLDAADIIVIPSRSDEPFGNTAVEGVLARRPVIVSDTSGLREAAAGFDSAVTVPADDAAAIADAVRRIADEWPEMRDAAERSAEDAATRLSPERYRRELVERMNALLAPRG